MAGPFLLASQIYIGGHEYQSYIFCSLLSSHTSDTVLLTLDLQHNTPHLCHRRSSCSAFKNRMHLSQIYLLCFAASVAATRSEFSAFAASQGVPDCAVSSALESRTSIFPQSIRLTFHATARMCPQPPSGMQRGLQVHVPRRKAFEQRRMLPY